MSLPIRRTQAAPWLKDSLWRRAQALPSLDLRFADNKSLVDSVSGQNLITFTRASSATFVGSDGVLRTAVTNLLLRSEEFDNASWIKIGSTVTANAGTAPDGTTTADLWTRTSTGASYIVPSLAKAASVIQYTFTVFAKQSVGNFCALRLQGLYPSRVDVVFNLSSGTVSASAVVSGSFTGPSASITPYQNGWYRLIVTATSDDSTYLIPVISFNSNGTVIDGTDSVSTSAGLLWGAQLEQASTAGEYIPTTSAVNSAPRFDHNPTTGESLGLLVEEQRTNLLLRSDQFDNASWGKAFGAITANNATAPDGTSAADTFIPTALTGLAYFQQNPTVVASSTYTWSVYLKASGYTWVFLDFYDGANHRSFFNLTGSGTVGTVEAGNTSTITAVGNGWYRCTLTRASANTSLFCAVAVTDADNSIPATYNGTSGINAWGAQLEAGAFATSYIPTTSAAATRAADVATITGITVAPGCIFAQFSSPASGSRGIVSINDNTANNRIELRTSGTDPFLTVVNGGATQADVDAGTIAANLTAKLAGRVATDNFGASASGGTEVLDSSGIVPSITQLQIGRDQAGNYLTGRLARLALWSLPDTTLQRLTQ